MEKQECGKGFISSLFTVATVSAGAYLCYRLARNLIAFCAVFDTPVSECAAAACDELEERQTDETAFVS